MKKNTVKKIKSLAKMEETYHQEIVVKPAKRLLAALLKTEKKEISSLIKTRKASTATR
jgi:hypothetical protein